MHPKWGTAGSIWDQGKTVYLILSTLTFVSLIAIVARSGNLQILSNPWILIMVGLAAFRGGRALSYNFIFDWLRAPFTRVVADSSGAGHSVVPKGQGVLRVLGELLSCPICTGTWVALVLSGLLALAYPFGLLATFVFAASGLGEMLHWRAERDEWQGRAAREEAGTAWLWKNNTNEAHILQPEECEKELPVKIRTRIGRSPLERSSMNSTHRGGFRGGQT